VTFTDQLTPYNAGRKQLQQPRASFFGMSNVCADPHWKEMQSGWDGSEKNINSCHKKLSLDFMMSG